MDQPRRIGLYGPFGWGNLGDAAIQEAMLHNIRQRVADAELVGISLNPANTEEIHGIRSVPILRSWHPPVKAASSGSAPEPPGGARKDRGAVDALKGLLRPAVEVLRELRFFHGCVKVLRGLDLLVISGGGQLSDDWGGPFDHPWSMFAWTGCARIAGTPVAIVSVGAGPIDSTLSRWFFHAALRLATYRSVRDLESRNFLLDGGCTLPVDVYPDLAFSHPAAPETTMRNDRPVVGVSPMSYFHRLPGVWPEQDQARYDQLMATLSGFTVSLLDSGHRVAVFVNQIRNDRYACDDLLGQIGDRPGIDAVPTRDLSHLMEQISAVDIVITSRLHGVILSYLQGKPVIALSYDPKIDAVMKSFDQMRFRLDIDRATPELLGLSFAALVADYERISARIRVTTRSNEERLQRQYDRLFGPRGDC